MAFEVVPGIDVAAGKLAGFTRAGPVPLALFDGDPLAAAARFTEAGARTVHVVDMDLAFEGEPGNLAVIEALAATGLQVQASGGIRRLSEVQRFLDAGASRIVLGSGALDDEHEVLGVIEALGPRLLVGLEVEGEMLRSRGRDSVDLPLVETLGWLVAAGAPAFLVTAVTRVGGMQGPDIEVVQRVIRAGVPVVAAGGVRTRADLTALREAGATGAVVGRAALEGELDLASIFSPERP
jgi:phosphoribosylformimino-5-aminoimidazole carboxamide ribonucleotide (ProFAR) isomerase